MAEVRVIGPICAFAMETGRPTAPVRAVPAFQGTTGASANTHVPPVIVECAMKALWEMEHVFATWVPGVPTAMDCALDRHRRHVMVMEHAASQMALARAIATAPTATGKASFVISVSQRTIHPTAP